jgi:hypothetical protein
VQRSGEGDEGNSHVTSYVILKHAIIGDVKENENRERTFGEEKFSLGNTAPSYSSMVARIWESSSGNAYRSAGLALASSSLSPSWSWSSSKVLFGGLK